MSDDKSRVTDKASEIAKNIWLAGVGAYGKAVEEAQGRLEKAMEPPKLFRDLVKAGTALEEDARGSTLSARHSVEERINRVRENFHNQRPARVEDLVTLQKKVDQLSRKVDKLHKELAAQRAGANSQEKMRSPAKKSASSSAKASAKKVPATTRRSKSATTNTGKPNPARKQAAASKRKI